ncbi:hypothetical protein NDU88_001349 [Pleurodeles waltl]|uniref:Uncharacterized protein n=1 Tax=Pleurodeles waltl TaxID=8319 RepID=A0AAV7KPD3_PLEWA|nr:hypothetical protein NDU88_001349 [Pleurodeles waltl]
MQLKRGRCKADRAFAIERGEKGSSAASARRMVVTTNKNEQRGEKSNANRNTMKQGERMKARKVTNITSKRKHCKY